MDDTYIITVVVIFDELCQTLLPAPKYRPKMTPAEILTVAVVAARSVGNHLERAFNTSMPSDGLLKHCERALHRLSTHTSIHPKDWR